MYRPYSSGGQKRADNSRTIEAAVVGASSIDSFFKLQDSRLADIPLAEAVVENADTAERRPRRSHC